MHLADKLTGLLSLPHLSCVALSAHKAVQSELVWLDHHALCIGQTPSASTPHGCQLLLGHLHHVTDSAPTYHQYQLQLLEQASMLERAAGERALHASCC